MSDLTTRIEGLEPAKAVRILRTIARQRLRNQQADALVPDTALATDLATEVGATLDAAASEGDVAKASLLLVAEDSSMRPVLDAMIDNLPAEDFAVDPITLAVGVGALVVLQSYIKFERSKDGKWTFKFEKRPMSGTLLGNVIAKLGGWLGAK